MRRARARRVQDHRPRLLHGRLVEQRQRVHRRRDLGHHEQERAPPRLAGGILQPNVKPVRISRGGGRLIFDEGVKAHLAVVGELRGLVLHHRGARTRAQLSVDANAPRLAPQVQLPGGVLAQRSVLKSEVEIQYVEHYSAKA